MSSAVQTKASMMEWIAEHAFGGLCLLSGAAQLGEEYVLDETYAGDQARAEHLVRQEIGRHYTSGFLSGFAARLQPPPLMQAMQAAAWVVEARLAGAVATVFGHDLSDARVRTVAIGCLLGEQLSDVLTQVVGLRERVPPEYVLARLDDAHLPDLAAKIETMLGMAEGIGSLTTATAGAHALHDAADATGCFVAGQTAIRVFQGCASPGRRIVRSSQQTDVWEPPS